jgi:ribosomal protein L23
MSGATITNGTASIHSHVPSHNAIDPVAKATKAKKATLKGAKPLKARKVHMSTRFRRPKTLKLKRQPRYVRKAITKEARLDPYAVIKQPLATESAMRKMEDHNTLVFLCDPRATKVHIREAVKTLYKVQAASVNTLLRPDGVKKAYVRLVPEADALEVAGRIGFI